MNKMKIVLCAICAVVLVTGCQTKFGQSFSDSQSLAIKSVKMASNTGTILALAEHPEWRPHFETAHASIGVLLSEKSISFAQLRIIMEALPIDELKSEEAKIIISNAELLFGDYLKELTPIDSVAAAPIVAQAIYDGLGNALRSTSGR
jgi:hypothetical protein